jgi:hypothetical protein
LHKNKNKNKNEDDNTSGTNNEKGTAALTILGFNKIILRGRWPGMNNNRKRKRINYHVSVQLTLDDRILSGHCENLSMSGMLITTSQEVPQTLRGKVEICQTLGENSLVVESGFQVIWTKRNQEKQVFLAGLNFHGLDPDSSITLYNMIRYQSGEE